MLARAASVNCVNGSTNVWNQAFSYGSDAFGNLTKSSSGPGLSWMPFYNTANNQYALMGTSYDANGNLLTDTFHTYTWLADGHVASVDGSTVTYDAMGNKVEENLGAVNEYVSAFGISAQMSGQTEDATNVDLPGGVQALYAGGTLQRFRFPDWEGTIRAESSTTTRQFTESLAFAPFGERYALQGAPYNVDSFTGKPDQITSDEYDFEARELHNGQGRWISPDPMPGTGNKYVYADNNPLSKVDLLGLIVMFSEENGVAGGDESTEAAAEMAAESHGPNSSQTGGETPSTAQPPTGSGSSTQQPAPSQQPQPQPPSPADQAKNAAQQQSDKNTDVMLMSNHANPQYSQSNNAGQVEVEWHIVPQANNVSDPQLQKQSTDATAEKYSQSSILLDESRRTKPEWHWEGSRTGSGLDHFDQSALPANQKWYINTGGGNNSSNQRIQVVVGMKPDGTLIKAWTVHVEWEGTDLFTRRSIDVSSQQRDSTKAKGV